MSEKIELTCTHAEFHTLLEAVDNNRKIVRVERAALVALLADHGALIRKFRADVGGIT